MHHDPRAWKEAYERDGYLCVEDCIDPATLATLRQTVEKFTTNPDALPGHLRQHVELERDYSKSRPQYNELKAEQIGTAVRKLMETPLLDHAFADIICYNPVLDVLEALFGSTEFHFHNYKCIIKAPQVSSAFRWHRDLPYLDHSTPNLITAMLCLDPMTAENGATVVLPGSHRPEDMPVDPADMDIPVEKLPKNAEHKTVSCKAGALVLFHVNIIHGGGPNRSSIPRRNLIGIWAGPETYNITPMRYAYEGVYPRSKQPALQRQMRLSFPRVFGETKREAVGAAR